jgi:transglutaminase-like putative cysteine protease
MQSASPSPRFQPALIPARVWGRTRASLTGAAAWSFVLIVLLTIAVARSTATAGWVGGIDVVTPVALGGAVLMGVLAVLPIPWGVALGLGFIAGPIVAAIAAGPLLHAAHPSDSVSIGMVSIWWSRVVTGSASSDAPGYALFADPSFYLYLICLLMWVTGGWLSWCVLRWRRPMLGLVPGAAAFATNVLDIPADQNGYTLAILVLTLALLLWTNYTSSIANATRARVKLTGDARWDFWESGLVAMAALIVLGIMLPPLSTIDRTIDLESSAFSNWAQLQQSLSHATSIGRVTTGVGTTGFSSHVGLGGALKRSKQVVFTYTLSGSSGPHYFRGLDITQTFQGEWEYAASVNLAAAIPKNTIPLYGEDYQKLGLTYFDIKMAAPPDGFGDILFYPGALFKVDRDTRASQAILPFDSSLLTIDRLSSVVPPLSTGTYNITVEYSTATEADLQKAGTAYPDWLTPFYTSLPTFGYRNADVLKRIHQLAVQVTRAAGAVTPYDKAKAIEAYLRSSANFTYTLDPPTAPPGRDRLDYFLFDSHKGYCEFFASAMGDMMRSLGIPTRLVNGFGPGQYTTTTQNYVVRAEDAHTWVEVYFPKYGWNTFEPTPDGVYDVITRGSTGPNTCLKDSGCSTPTGVVGGPVAGPSPRTQKEVTPGAIAPSGGGTGGFHLPDPVTITKIVGIVLALLLGGFAAAARYLRPRSVMHVWKRTLVLARMAGAERRAGETPLELGRRLAHAFPEASGPVRSLADGFVVSAYAPPDLAGSARASVMEAWAALRPLLLRRVVSRLRPSRTNL